MDGQTQYVGSSSDILAEGLSLVRHNECTGMSVSSEIGYRFAIPLGGIDFHVAPQIQVIWSRAGFDDFVGPHNEQISLEDGYVMRGRLGLSWDGEWRGAEGSGHLYGGVNLRGAFDGREIGGLHILFDQAIH